MHARLYIFIDIYRFWICEVANFRCNFGEFCINCLFLLLPLMLTYFVPVRATFLPQRAFPSRACRVCTLFWPNTQVSTYKNTIFWYCYFIFIISFALYDTCDYLCYVAAYSSAHAHGLTVSTQISGGGISYWCPNKIYLCVISDGARRAVARKMLQI